MCGDDNVDDDDIDADKVMMTMPIDDAGFCWLFFVFLLVDIRLLLRPTSKREVV